MLPRDHYLKQTFQDIANFPNGFEKGGLSDIQARLIRKQGTLINALMQDEVSDPTPDDLHVLKVIANQSAPKSPIEQAWVKYLSIVKTKQATTKASKVKPEKTVKATDTTTDSSTDAQAKPEKEKSFPEKPSSGKSNSAKHATGTADKSSAPTKEPSNPSLKPPKAKKVTNKV